jgi:hypothetical protein
MIEMIGLLIGVCLFYKLSHRLFNYDKAEVTKNAIKVLNNNKDSKK